MSQCSSGDSQRGDGERESILSRETPCARERSCSWPLHSLVHLIAAPLHVCPELSRRLPVPLSPHVGSSLFARQRLRNLPLFCFEGPLPPTRAGCTVACSRWGLLCLPSSARFCVDVVRMHALLCNFGWCASFSRFSRLLPENKNKSKQAG